MANKRQLRKAICRACGQIAGEALVAQAAMDFKDVAPKFDKKPKDFANGKEYKNARRVFYKAQEKELAAYMKDEVSKIVNQMNALLPKK